MHLIESYMSHSSFPPQQLYEMILSVANQQQNENTRQTYFSVLNRFLQWYQSTGRSALDVPALNEYLLYLEALQLSRATIATHLSAIRNFISTTRKYELIDANTYASLMEIRVRRQSGRRHGNWLSLAEVQCLLNEMHGDAPIQIRDRAIIALLLGTGLRRFELTNLRLEDIAMIEDRRVLHNIVGKGSRYRTIPIPEWSWQSLAEWIETRRSSHLENNTRLFFSYLKSGQRRADSITSQAIRNIVKKHTERTLGVPFLPHDLRRTYAKLAYKAGAPLAQIQMALGHSSIRTTELYLGLEQDLQQSPGDYISVNINPNNIF